MIFFIHEMLEAQGASGLGVALFAFSWAWPGAGAGDGTHQGLGSAIGGTISRDHERHQNPGTFQVNNFHVPREIWWELIVVSLNEYWIMSWLKNLLF